MQITPQHVAGIHLYSWVERGTMRVKSLSSNPAARPESSEVTIMPPRLPLATQGGSKMKFIQELIIKIRENYIPSVATYLFIPQSSMKSISFFPPELRRLPKISKTTALLSNYVDGTWVLRITRLVQACESLKISHGLIKFSFAHVSRRQVAVSLQVILTLEKEEETLRDKL